MINNICVPEKNDNKKKVFQTILSSIRTGSTFFYQGPITFYQDSIIFLPGLGPGQPL